MDKPEAVTEESRGIVLARNAGLIRLGVAANMVYAIPTESLIELASQRIAWLFALDTAEKVAILREMMRGRASSRV